MYKKGKRSFCACAFFEHFIKLSFSSEKNDDDDKYRRLESDDNVNKTYHSTA